MPEPASLRLVKSRRLNLIATTTELLKKDISGSEHLAEALGVAAPDSWPPDLYGPSAMRYALEQLGEPTEQCWSFWYLTTPDEPRELVGICGFKGRPDASGSVEIGYSVLEQFRHKGLASEAVASLVGWAFTHHNVSEVSAETFPYLTQSIRVLEKNGFVLTGAGSEAGVVRYAVKRSSLI